MKSLLFHPRWRFGVVALVLSVCLMTSLPSVRADDEPVPDPAGGTISNIDPGSPTTQPTGSVPGFIKLDDKSTPKQMADSINAVASSASATRYGLNLTWTLVAGFLVMFMQAGFALVETGLCRAKNAAHVMSMNFLVYALGMTGFFICGYALMCGGGGPAATFTANAPVLNKMFTIGDGWGLFGTKGFFLSGAAYDSAAITWFLFMMVFMDTTATIPTGALAERWSMKSFFIFSLFIGGILYPIYGCWVWGGGWIAQLGAKAGLGHGGVDFAGSSVVHLQGGAIALITCLLLGPRIGKYDENGKPKPILGHNIPMVILGTFILAFGWFGFNAGSSLAADGRIGVTAVNTMLASASGALASCLYMWIVSAGKKPDPSMMCNGMLAGLVAITAPCAFVTPVAAFLIGGISGVLVVWAVFFFEKIGIDDPVGAISVHGVNGLWGVLALGLFADGTYGAGTNGVGGDTYLGVAGKGVTGLFYGDAKQFYAQCIMSVACITWNVVAAGIIFWVLGKVLGSNRVPPEIEIAGLDIPEMGAPGYPEYVTIMAPENVPASQISDAKARIPQIAAM